MPPFFDLEVKWFTDGAQFNTNHEMIIWLWSSCMASSNWCTKFPFACIPMRLLPTKSLRSKANKAIVKVIAWDSILTTLVKFAFLAENTSNLCPWSPQIVSYPS